MEVTEPMTDYQRGYDNGLAKAYMMLMRSAAKLHASKVQTSITVAKVLEHEAEEILFKRNSNPILFDLEDYLQSQK